MTDDELELLGAHVLRISQLEAQIDVAMKDTQRLNWLEAHRMVVWADEAAEAISKMYGLRNAIDVAVLNTTIKEKA